MPDQPWTPSTTPSIAPTTGPTTAPTTGQPVPSRLVFRVPSVALLGVLFLAVCQSAVALAAPWLYLLYLLPLGIMAWILRTRTVADADQLVVRRVFTRRVLPWSEIVSLRMRDGRWVRAVLADGAEVPLPAVRTRHLSALALVTGGRLADPLAAPLPTPVPTEPVTEPAGSPIDSADDSADQPSPGAE